MTDELAVVYTAFRAKLAASVTWGDRAYADFVPASTPDKPIVRPYVVYGFTGGGDDNNTLKADPDLIIDVICVADLLSTALAGASEIRALLDDQGSLDSDRNMFGDSDWSLKTITDEGRIHFVEQVDGGATQIYHSGRRFRVLLEEK